MKNLQDKIAFVTGGASGIGFGMVRAFLQAGMRVFIADASGAYLDEAVAKLKDYTGRYRTLTLDVIDRAAMARAADEVERAFGAVHVLCNNAGIGMAPSVLTAGHADWDHMLGINLGGVINGIVSFLPRLRAHGQGGHIVNTSSMAGIIPLPDPGTLYTTSKFAVRGLSESLRLALTAERIGVSVLCPGLTLTRILDEARAAMRAGPMDELSAGFVNAQKFAMDPLLVGQAVVDAIRNNDLYILPHREFVAEVAELHAELLGAFRTDLPMDPDRAAFEQVRRQLILDLKARQREG